MIDWIRVQDLREEIGDDSFAEVIELFLEETDEVISRLTAAAMPTDDLARDLHFLKGSALNLGFSDLANLCHDGERNAARGDTTLIDLPKITASYAESKSDFLTGLAQTNAA